MMIQRSVGLEMLRATAAELVRTSALRLGAPVDLFDVLGLAKADGAPQRPGVPVEQAHVQT
eukprot:7176382-Alexandrium_andersonii.AAC.1